MGRFLQNKVVNKMWGNCVQKIIIRSESTVAKANYFFLRG